MELHLEPERIYRNPLNGRFLKGRTSPFKGKKWKDFYSNERIEEIIAKIKKTLQPCKKGNCPCAGHNRKGVVAIKDGSFVFFKSIKEGSKMIGISPANILRCCKKQRKSAGGWQWFYEDDNSWCHLIGNDYLCNVPSVGDS